MNSRKMERADIKVHDPEHQIGGSEVVSTLRALLKRPHLGAPERLLILGGFQMSQPTNPALAKEVESLSLTELPETKSYDAILWRTTLQELESGHLGRVRQALRDQSKLLIHTPASRGLSPEAISRLLVHRLSEAGFVILKELSAKDLGAEDGAMVMARRDEYLIRPFNEGDEAAISRLFVSSFHIERGDQHWQWKYHRSPYGNRYMSLACSAEGELASHYAGFPVPFWQDGRSFLGLQMGDTMTGPQFRSVGRGVSSLLARAVRHFFARYRRGPFEFFYGFNTGAIQRFCKWFIGGSQVEPVRYLVRPHSEPPPAVRGYRVEQVTRLSDDWDRFFRRVAPRFGFLVQRDAEYVDWRYLRCPDGEPYVVLAARRWGRLVGWGVFRRREDRLIWGDALIDPRHARAAGAILARALETETLETETLKTEARSGITNVEGWFSDRPDWWNAELRRLGFGPMPQPDKLGFMILPDREEDPPLSRLYYTMGDGDLF